MAKRVSKTMARALSFVHGSESTARRCKVAISYQMRNLKHYMGIMRIYNNTTRHISIKISISSLCLIVRWLLTVIP